MTANPFRPAEQVAPKVKALLYGTSGIGKTYCALTSPGKVAVIDTEGGTSFYASRVGTGGLSAFDVLPTKTFAQVEQAIAYLKANPGDYETLVIDPVTVLYETLQDAALRYRTDKSAQKARQRQESFDPDNVDLEQLDWGRIKRSYKRLMTDLVNLPLHVVVIAREADLTEEQMVNGRKQRTKIGAKPDAEKSTTYYFDAVIRLVPGQKGGRDAVVEKDRTGSLELGARIPNPTFAALFSKAIAVGGTGVRSLESDAEAAAIDAATTLTAGSAEAILAQPDGSYVGTAEVGKSPADLELRETKDGFSIAFRLTAHGKSMKVVATGPLAEAIAAVRHAIESEQVACYGAVSTETFTPEGTNRKVSYNVLTLDRLVTPDLILPATPNGSGSTPEAAGGPPPETATPSPVDTSADDAEIDALVF